MVHGGNLLRSDNCGFATYECRTVYDTELADNQWKRAEQSLACRTRENQLLTKQRDEAHERIKRLEEAFTELEQCNLTDENCANMDVATRRIRNFARKAKEAKP
jgi:DNA-binding transcriptional MerR regulator